MQHKKKIITIIVITVIIFSSLSILQINEQLVNVIETDTILTLFADEGNIHFSGGQFSLSDNITFYDNTSIIEIGNVNLTKDNDMHGFGFEVDWKSSFNRIWITIELLFPIPERININDYAANITFFVDTFHNSSFWWQFDIPSVPLEETQTSLPSYWRNGTSKGNNTLVVNTTAKKTDKFEIAVIDGNVHAQFSMVIVPNAGEFSKVLITFGKIDIWKL